MLLVYVQVLLLNCYSNIRVRRTISLLYSLKYKVLMDINWMEREVQSAHEWHCPFLRLYCVNGT